MTDAAEQRIAVLESELRALKLLLGTRARTLTPPPRPAEPSVKIVHPTRQVELPTDDEFHQLLEVVLTRYPKLRPRADQQAFGEQFRVAFQRLLHVGRQARLDVSRGLEAVSKLVVRRATRRAEL